MVNTRQNNQIPVYDDDGGVFIRRARQPFAYARNRRDYSFLLVENGVQDVCINGDRRTLFRDSIAFCDGKDAHYHYTASPYAVITELLLSESFFRRFNESGGGKTLPPFMTDPDKNSPALNIAARWYAHPHKNLDINHGFADLFLGELKLSYGLITPENKKPMEIFWQFLDYIDLNYTDNISLDTLSEEFGYTPQYCSKIFNDCAGEHLRRYLNRLRLNRMREELETSPEARRNIRRTARRHGFASANTYYRTLKEFSAAIGPDDGGGLF